MSETEQQSSQDANSASVPAPAGRATAGVRPANPLALAALVVALLAGVSAVVLWSDVREMRRDGQSAEAQLRASVETLLSKEQEQRSTLSAESRQRDQQLAERQELLEAGLQAVRDELGRERVEWLVAETDYLLRIASRRLLLERDVRGALIALRSADALLADGANPLYLPVREQLRAELQSLEGVPRVDVDGISLDLSAISRQIEQLPLATARRAVNQYQSGVEETPVDSESSWAGRLFGAMWREVKSLVTIRHLGQKVQPLLPPEERYFLAQNLRLRLENARLALLRGEAALYQENLQVAAQWLDDYFDSDDAAVRSHLVTLQRLAGVNIAPPLPEIGDALRALDKIRARSGGQGAMSRGKNP